jgi:hypothetical protein
VRKAIKGKARERKNEEKRSLFETRRRRRRRTPQARL